MQQGDRHEVYPAIVHKEQIIDQLGRKIKLLELQLKLANDVLDVVLDIETNCCCHAASCQCQADFETKDGCVCVCETPCLWCMAYQARHSTPNDLLQRALDATPQLITQVAAKHEAERHADEQTDRSREVRQ